MRQTYMEECELFNLNEDLRSKINNKKKQLQYLQNQCIPNLTASNVTKYNDPQKLFIQMQQNIHTLLAQSLVQKQVSVKEQYDMKKVCAHHQKNINYLCNVLNHKQADLVLRVYFPTNGEEPHEKQLYRQTLTSLRRIQQFENEHPLKDQIQQYLKQITILSLQFPKKENKKEMEKNQRFFEKIPQRDFEYYQHLGEKIQYLDIVKLQKTKEIQTYSTVLNLLRDEEKKLKNKK